MIYIFRKNLPDFFLSKPKFLYLYLCHTNQINKEMIYRLYILIIPLLFIQTQIIAQNQEQPNIVLIISDDHAYQTISAYGYDQVETPQIDRIADEGMRLDRAYVTNSICGPSRATILTGKYSHINGFKDNATSNYNSSQFQFVNGLQDAGYQTAWIGKYHLGDDPQDRKSTRLNSSHVAISYAVFCLKK